MAKKKALAREDRQRQIVLAFAVEMHDGKQPEMTVADIARKLQMTPSSFLRGMITELVIEGVLDERKEDIPGIAKFRRIYSPNPKHFKIPTPHYGRQNRAIKVNGKQVSFFAEIGS